MAENDTRTPDGDKSREASAANLFDLRRILGGLFLLYGAILVVVGLVDSDAQIARAALSTSRCTTAYCPRPSVRTACHFASEVS